MRRLFLGSLLLAGCAAAPTAPQAPALTDADIRALAATALATCERKYGARTPEALSCAAQLYSQSSMGPARATHCRPDDLGGFRCTDE